MPGQPWKKPRVLEELYDLVNDPYEKKNLVNDKKYKKQLEIMRKKLVDIQKETNDEYLNKTFSKDYKEENYKPVQPGHKYF